MIKEPARQAHRLLRQTVPDLEGEEIPIERSIVTSRNARNFAHSLPTSSIRFGLWIIAYICQMIWNRYHLANFGEFEEQIPVHGIVQGFVEPPHFPIGITAKNNGILLVQRAICFLQPCKPVGVPG